jgi:hypothetical protein
MTVKTKTMWRIVRKNVAHLADRNFLGLAMVLLTFGTVMFRCSLPEHSTSLEFDTMQAELDSNNNQDAENVVTAPRKGFDYILNSKRVAPKKSIPEQDAKQNTKNMFPMPPPISYFQHGNNGLEDYSSYCIHNSKSDSCCSDEHCATIVKRSTLYSECCGHVHDNNTASGSKIFPLLITSAPRSGTWFMQQLLTKTGLQGLTTDERSPEGMGTVSWKHIFQQDDHYFGRQQTTRLYNSKFRVIWHLVRDPLKTLTSIAFTDPLWEDSDHSRIYVEHISRHIPITNKTTLMARFNISDHELEGVMEHRTIAMNRNPKLSRFLIHRGLEIYLYWNGFINYLNVPVFKLEDLAADKNVTILDEMFRSVGYDPPNHAKILQVLDAQEVKRHEHHRRRLAELRHYQGNTRGYRIRKGSRIHRDTLTWKEICAVSLTKAHALLKMSHSFGYYTDVPEEGLCT